MQFLARALNLAKAFLYALTADAMQLNNYRLAGAGFLNESEILDYDQVMLKLR